MKAVFIQKESGHAKAKGFGIFNVWVYSKKNFSIKVTENTCQNPGVFHSSLIINSTLGNIQIELQTLEQPLEKVQQMALSESIKKLKEISNWFEKTSLELEKER